MMRAETDLNGVTNVLVVEDEEIFRSGLRIVLSPFADQLAIVGEADNTADAIAKVETLVPDVVLMDLHLPSFAGDLKRDWRHGVDAIAKIRSIAPTTQVLVLSHLGKQPLVGRDLRIVFDALEAGARGYLTKDAGFNGETLASSIRRIDHGEAIYGSTIARRLREYPHMLTQREREVLDLLAEGKSDQDIAAILFIALKTVKHHVSSILLKLHARSRHVLEEVPSDQELIPA